MATPLGRLNEAPVPVPSVKVVALLPPARNETSAVEMFIFWMYESGGVPAFARYKLPLPSMAIPEGLLKAAADPVASLVGSDAAAAV